jgi:pullulanase/glycogen debranching enzyme
VRTHEPDTRQGMIDHNSYNKDNETNWLNYGHAELNQELVDYYRGLIALRKKYAAFRNTLAEHIQFKDGANPYALSFGIDRQHSADGVDLLVLVNSHKEEAAAFTLPKGPWQVLVNGDKAGTDAQLSISETEILLPPTTGMVLIK